MARLFISTGLCNREHDPMKKLVIVLGMIAAGCSKNPAPPAPGQSAPLVPVHTAHSVVRDVPLFFETIGTVQPHQAVEVKSRIHGTITGVHFTEGQWVEKGDLLYTIEEDSYAIKVQEMQAHLLQDQTHLKNAQKKLKRYKSLSNQDLIAQVEWDEIETQVSLHKAMVKADQARLAAAELDLEHCQILAPISGYAGKTALQEGNRTDGSPLLTLSHPEPFHVDFSITEKELQKLSSSSLGVEVYPLGGEECLATGSVTFLDNRLDPASGLLAARAVLSSPSKPLWTGQSIRIHLFFGEKKNALLIPLKAIRTNQNGPYVFSVKENDNTVEMITVALGPEEKDWVVVEEGLKEASKIVTEGHNRLFPGSKIEEVK